jgi:hypothetical protein
VSSVDDFQHTSLEPLHVSANQSAHDHFSLALDFKPAQSGTDVELALKFS